MNSLRSIILFKNGLGCFERSVGAGTTLELDFQASQIDDIIKSMVILDGSVENIFFDAKRSIDEELDQLGLSAIDGDGDALLQLLLQLKGVAFTIQTSASKHSGRLVGIDERQEAVDEVAISVHYVVIVTDDNQLQSVRLPDILTMTPADDRTKSDLHRLFEAGLYWKATERKKLVIGSNEAEVRFCYMIPVAVWTSSYRFLLRDSGEVMMQAWALVHNTSTEDWNQVDLSLASGMPMSFEMDLYTPLFRKRPAVTRSKQEDYAAPVVGRSFDEPAPPPGSSAKRMSKRSPVQAEFAMPPMPEPMMASAFAEESQVEQQSSSFAPVSFFVIDEPITIPAGKTALVSLFTKPIEGRRVALYRSSIRKQNPMTAVELRNTTSFDLEEGPVTVYAADGYLGEGMLPSIGSDETIVIPFAIETGMLVDTDQKSNTLAVHRLYAKGGVIYFQRKLVRTTVYRFRRSGSIHFDTLYVDHPEAPGWTIQNEGILSRSEGFVRFAVSADVDEFQITEEYVQTESVRILSGGGWLDTVMATGLIPEKQGAGLRRIAELGEQVEKLSAQEESIEQHQSEIVANQDRIRENLKAFSTSTEETSLRRRYVQQLENDENQLVSFKDDMAKIRGEKQATINERDRLVHELHFDFLIDENR